MSLNRVEALEAADTEDSGKCFLQLPPAVHMTAQMTSVMNAHPCMAVFDSCCQGRFDLGNIPRQPNSLVDCGIPKTIVPEAPEPLPRLTAEDS
jgi:hypothetical protein